MSTHTTADEAELNYYQGLIALSEKHFGEPLEILESHARERVEHALSASCGGFALTLNCSRIKGVIRLKENPYVRDCTRRSMFIDEHDTLYALIDLPENTVWDLLAGDSGTPCDQALCVFPGSGSSPRFYVLRNKDMDL